MVLQFHGMGEKSLTVLKAVKTMQLSKQQWFHIYRGVAAGLSYIHSKGFLHNDLKSNNIAIENTGGQYNSVIDFGKRSKVSDVPKRITLSKQEQSQYSSSYPHITLEIVDGSSGPSLKSDIFSFGKLLQYVLACAAVILQNPKMRPELSQILKFQFRRK